MTTAMEACRGWTGLSQQRRCAPRAGQGEAQLGADGGTRADSRDRSGGRVSLFFRRSGKLEPVPGSDGFFLSPVPQWPTST